MKLFGSPGSPFARKVRIVLEEKGIAHEYVVARGSAPGSPVPQFNPLGKVPTLIRDDGRPLYDSPVIVEYLDGIGPGPRLIPDAPADRIEVRRWEALGDGVTEATVLVNHDLREPKEKQHDAAWHERQRAKITRGLAAMEKDLGSAEHCFGGRFTLADIAVGYALGYLDFALPDVAWRKAHPALARLADRLSSRPSFEKTRHEKPKG
jgi:glutathione S-transferase